VAGVLACTVGHESLPGRGGGANTMKLTKYEHACVVFEKEGASFVIDPGSFSPNAPQIVAGTEAILLTHEHYDHLNEAAVKAALTERPDLRVYAPAAMAGTFGDYADQFTAVQAGDELKVAGFNITVHGTIHAAIHADIPPVANVGYLVDENVYHPGDAYFVPDQSVGTLLLPTSGPWMKIGEAADYVRAVRPDQTVQIHEMLQSEIGLNLAAMLLGENGLTGLPFIAVPLGESVTV
jgi:L-ascorbate metabolism protein UlaG (beta-lactamase superfamily)